MSSNQKFSRLFLFPMWMVSCWRALCATAQVLSAEWFPLDASDCHNGTWPLQSDLWSCIHTTHPGQSPSKQPTCSWLLFCPDASPWVVDSGCFHCKDCCLFLDCSCQNTVLLHMKSVSSGVWWWRSSQTPTPCWFCSWVSDVYQCSRKCM